MSHESHEATDSEHDWGEVNLQGVEVTDVGHVEIAEHADGAVDEDHH